MKNPWFLTFTASMALLLSGCLNPRPITNGQMRRCQPQSGRQLA